MKSIPTNVDTSAGSNCVPAHRASSAKHLLAVDALAGAAVEASRVERVGQREDARDQRDVLARQAVGVAAAVPLLVVAEDAGEDRGQAGDVAEDAVAGLRMAVDLLDLGVVEAALAPAARLRRSSTPSSTVSV